MTNKTAWGTPVNAFEHREAFYRQTMKRFEKVDNKVVYLGDNGCNENGLWWNVWSHMDIPLYSYDIAARFRTDHELEEIYETDEIEYIGVVYDEDDHCIAELCVSRHLQNVVDALVAHTLELYKTFGEEIENDYPVIIVSDMQDAHDTKFEDPNDFDCFG